ncbi:MAG: RimK family alpha-L-glutamate ligase [Clostridiales bacterium]|nr:RimK family alpha-L-glutamate ligase [Clostridiales bacterium]
MLNGLLAVNAFLKTPKFDAIYQALLEAAMDNGVTLSVVTNADIALRIDNPEFLAELPDFVLFWDKDVKTARLLEQLGLPVFNPADAILQCDDKALTYLALRQAGVAMPETIIVPKTFPNVGYTHTGFLDDAVKKLGFPLVLKECFGSFGQQVYLYKDIESLREKVIALRSTPMILQSMIMNSYGRDIRINVVGGEVVASIMRHNDSGDFRSNITLGGSMEPYTPTEEEARLALKAVEVLGLAFAGVDVLFGENGPLICEVNSNAHFKTTLQCTGINMADRIFKYIATLVG